MAKAKGGQTKLAHPTTLAGDSLASLAKAANAALKAKEAQRKAAELEVRRQADALKAEQEVARQAYQRALEAKRNQRIAQAKAIQHQAALEHVAHGVFIDAVGPVAPIKEQNRAVVNRPKPAPVPRQPKTKPNLEKAPAISDWDAAVDVDASGDYRRPSMPPDTLKKLRRGQYPVAAKLDLHGKTSDQTRELLAAFLHEAFKADQRCVKIVHGKGTRSAAGEPVLKRLVRRMLFRYDNALAYCEARQEHGGGGALLVLMRANPDAEPKQTEEAKKPAPKPRPKTKPLLKVTVVKSE
jgi:DNA-nicking Smr family endonuclease